MATGRTVINRRKGANRQSTATARNTLPKKGSKEGIEARHDRRLKHHPNGDLFPKVGPQNQTGPKPGSRNPRKVGR